jgi:hypothetical protein
VHEIRPSRRPRIRHLPPQKRQCPPVVERDLVVQRRDPDPHRHAIRQAPEPCLALAQFLLGSPPLLQFQAQLLVGESQFRGSRRHLLFQVRPQPSQFHVRPHPRQQLRPLIRFGDEVRRTQAEPQNPLLQLARCAQENDRNPAARFIRLQAAANLEPVHPRHSDIQHDQLRRRRLYRCQRQLAAVGRPHPVALRRQDIRQKPERVGVVIDHQNRAHLVHGLPSTALAFRLPIACKIVV